MDILDFCTCTREDGSYSYDWRTFGDLLDRLQRVTGGADEIRQIRWEGIPNARDEEESLPPADAITINVERHFHDEIPKIRIYAQQAGKDGTITAEYLYGLVYDPSTGSPDDWTQAFELAARLRGAISPDNNRRRHPNYDRHGTPLDQ